MHSVVEQLFVSQLVVSTVDLFFPWRWVDDMCAVCTDLFCIQCIEHLLKQMHSSEQPYSTTIHSKPI